MRKDMASKTRGIILVQVQEEERRRLARMLHDTVGQNIAALQMNLSIVAESEHVLPTAKRKALADSVALTQTCGRDIRGFSYDLYPPLLDDAGLLVGLRAYFGNYSQRTGTKIQLVLPSRFGRLPREVEIGLFRIAQEALIAVHRISRGSTTLRIRRRTGSLILELIHQASLMTSDLNLAGIRERTRLLRSTLAIESAADSLTLRVVLPAVSKLKVS
jgi:signal transduction histidine kinase